MSYKTLRHHTEHHVSLITFNRPEKLNAFNKLMIKETIKALDEAARLTRIRCVVLTGDGNSFSSGQDLTEFGDLAVTNSLENHLRQGYNALVSRMISLEKPIVAAVNGVAAGAGLGVALAADIRLASSRARFIHAFTRIGLVPDSGSTWTLPRLIGFGRAMEMALTGKPISADLALSWGLVNEVIPHDQLMPVAITWAQSLASGPTVAFGLTKQAMYSANRMTIEEALENEAELQAIAGKTADFREGVRSFLEKRKPKFTGE